MCALTPRVGSNANARGEPLSGCDYVVVAEQRASTGVPVAVSGSLSALEVANGWRTRVPTWHLAIARLAHT